MFLRARLDSTLVLERRRALLWWGSWAYYLGVVVALSSGVFGLVLVLQDLLCLKGVGDVSWVALLVAPFAQTLVFSSMALVLSFVGVAAIRLAERVPQEREGE